MIPFLTYAQNRDLREKLYKGYYMRGNNDNANDNKAVLAKMVNLRTEKAKLLGFDTYAAYVVDVILRGATSTFPCLCRYPL